MKITQEDKLKAAAWLGLIPDGENPLFIFTQTHKHLLIDIISGKIDNVEMEMARAEMKNRGLDLTTGKWMGWKHEGLSC